MNRLTILGCMAGAPAAESPASGYLVQSQDKTILVDCGPGIVAALAKLGMIEKLDAVFISHRHADHCADLVALAYARLFPRILPPLPLFGPEDLQTTLEGLNHLFAIPSLASLQSPLTSALPFIALYPGQKTTVTGMEISTHLMQHPVETLAYHFIDLNLVYTADGALTTSLINFAQGTQTLLAEATYLQDTRANLSQHGHMTATDAAHLANCCGTQTLILTHFATTSQIELSLIEARTGFPNSQIAQAMRIFDL